MWVASWQCVDNMLVACPPPCYQHVINTSECPSDGKQPQVPWDDDGGGGYEGMVILSFYYYAVFPSNLVGVACCCIMEGEDILLIISQMDIIIIMALGIIPSPTTTRTRRIPLMMIYRYHPNTIQIGHDDENSSEEADELISISYINQFSLNNRQIRDDYLWIKKHYNLNTDYYY